MGKGRGDEPLLRVEEINLILMPLRMNVWTLDDVLNVNIWIRDV